MVCNSLEHSRKMSEKMINEVLNASQKWFQILVVSLSLVLAALANGIKAESYITTLLCTLQTPFTDICNLTLRSIL